MIYKLDIGFQNFDSATSEAIKVSSERNEIVEFEFNGIICRVNKHTDPDLLYRDYSNAHIMNWETVGPFFSKEYLPVVQAELDKRISERKAMREKQERECRDKEKRQRNEFEAKVSGIEIELSDPEGWEKSREANSDDYGKAALDYAEGWAKLMQLEISKGKTISDCYKYTQNGLGFFGITGFMFGCAVGILSKTWKHGEELRKVHNKIYGIAENNEGVVNPALLTITA